MIISYDNEELSSELHFSEGTYKETSTSDTLVLRRYFQVTEYRVYEHTWDGF